MKYFLKACDVVNKGGINSLGEDGATFEDRVTGGYELFNLTVKEIKPIVFFKRPKITLSKQATGAFVPPTEAYYESKKLDAPFQSFSIENFDDDPIHTFIGGIDKTECRTYCTIVRETKPKEFLFYNLNHFVENNYWVVEATYSPRTGETVEIYLNRLNAEKVGFENTRQIIKIGSGKNKQAHRIRKIVYVCPKKEYEKQNEKLGKQIDWSHRWLVRGHWRKCEGTLGKDREGLHCIPNYTWVVDHVKGPENKILIADKTRLVKKTGEQIHV